jgi:hypothetical protein
MTRVLPNVAADHTKALTEVSILSDGWKSPLKVEVHWNNVLLPRAISRRRPVVKASFVFEQNRLLKRLLLRCCNGSAVHTIECHRELKVVDLVGMSIMNVARDKAAWVIELIFELAEFDMEYVRSFPLSIWRRLHCRCQG